MDTKKYSHTLGGKTFWVELTDWARQANGSVLVRLGDTLVLATAVISSQTREGIDFFPLMVEYEEKFYAAGKILGSRFIKRETRPSEEAVLVGRFIDRSIRPRFDHRMRNEVQVVLTILSVDDQNDPDVPSLLAASLALALSNIPWNGPVAGVRVGKTPDGKLIVNPDYTERENSILDAIISGTKEKINMIEAGAGEVPEKDFAEAVEWGFSFIKELVKFQEKIIQENGKGKIEMRFADAPEKLKKVLQRDFSSRIEKALYQQPKKAMKEDVSTLRKEWMERAEEESTGEFQKNAAEFMFEGEINNIVHKRILEKGERPDGRRPDELRPLRIQVGILPRVHGSGLFMRGETHALSTLTLGAPGDQQIVEGMEIRTKKRFLHHYNFPPFSTGEIKPMRGPGRREIGHGALAGRALLPLIPSKDDFPYTIRLVSEILSSNGSSSMASVCGSSLAMMDGGVPIKKHVAGAAMGLMMNEGGEYRVLTDIQGPEDHHGDMDFKVAGTKDGITAVQMDVKIEGVNIEMVGKTLEQALKARLQIIEFMESIIPEPRPELSQWAPRVNILKINPEKIGALIGPGGKVINDIIAETGTQIDIEDDGTVFITSETEEGMKKAMSMIKQVTREIKAGELLEGKVTRVFDFGAVVEFGPKQDGLIHISELAPWHVEKVTDIIKLGEIVPVRVRNVDEQGKISLSLKDVPGRYSQEEIEKNRNNGGRRSGPGRF